MDLERPFPAPGSPVKRRKVSHGSSASVLSHLYSIHEMMETSFPLAAHHETTLNPLSAHVHPHHQIHQQKTEIVNKVREARKSLAVFRDSWKAEKAQVEQARIHKESAPIPLTTVTATKPGDPDSLLERQRTILVRIMLDWCNNQSSLLPIRSSLRALTSHIASTSSDRFRATPFVNTSTLKSPTDRLISFGQSLGLDVSVDNENPDYGMGSGDDQSLRVDTLAFAARTVLLEVQVQQPATSQRDDEKETTDLTETPKQTAKDFKLIKLKASHFPNLQDEGVFLPDLTNILTANFQAYLDVVNRSKPDLELDTVSPPAITRELQAEKAFMVFGRNLQQLVDLDKVDAAAVPSLGTEEAAQPISGAGANFGHRFDDLQRIRKILQDILPDSNTEVNLHQETLPSCKLLPSNCTLNVNPILSIRAQANAVYTPLGDANSSRKAGEDLRTGWYLELDRPIIVGSDIFNHLNKSKQSMIGKKGTLSAILLDRASGLNQPVFAEHQGPNEDEIVFKLSSNGRSGLTIKRIGFSNISQLEEVVKILRGELTLQHLLKTCFTNSSMTRAESKANSDEASIDEELEAFMQGDKQPAIDSKISVRLDRDALHLEIPLDKWLQPKSLLMSGSIQLLVRPNTGTTSLCVVTSKGVESSASLNDGALTAGLIQARCDIPSFVRWLRVAIGSGEAETGSMAVGT